MKNPISRSSLKKIAQRFFEAPFELKVFFFFSFFVFFSEIFIDYFISKDFKESIIPFTGWAISLGYANCVFAIIILIYNPKTKYVFYVLSLLFLNLVLDIVHGIRDYLMTNGEYFSTNPYLSVSKWRPIWTMAIPAFWILVLLSPRIWKYCKMLKNRALLIQ